MNSLWNLWFLGIQIRSIDVVAKCWKWCWDSSLILRISLVGLKMILIRSIMFRPAKFKVSKGRGDILQITIANWHVRKRCSYVLIEESHRRKFEQLSSSNVRKRARVYLVGRQFQIIFHMRSFSLWWILSFQKFFHMRSLTIYKEVLCKVNNILFNYV
jgi:hypothetical protein